MRDRLGEKNEKENKERRKWGESEKRDREIKLKGWEGSMEMGRKTS